MKVFMQGPADTWKMVEDSSDDGQQQQQPPKQLPLPKLDLSKDMKVSNNCVRHAIQMYKKYKLADNK